MRIRALKVFYLIMIMIFPLCANASDVLISVTGSVISPSCSVSSASQNMEVKLGNYATNSFTGVGSRSPATPFTIELERCNSEVVSNIRIMFNGDLNPVNPELLALDGRRNAGVAIKLLDKNKQKIPFNQYHSLPMLGGAENYAFLFYAQYEAVSDSVVAGAAEATATFVLTYE